MSRMLGSLYSPRLAVTILPSSAARSSLIAKPKPWIMPPSTCPRCNSGLMMVPTSWAEIILRTFTCPVSGSTRTSATSAKKHMAPSRSLISMLPRALKDPSIDFARAARSAKLTFAAPGPDGSTSLQTDRVRRTAKQRRSELNQLVAHCEGCLLDRSSAQVGDQTGDHSDIGREHVRGAHSNCNIVG